MKKYNILYHLYNDKFLDILFIIVKNLFIF